MNISSAKRFFCHAADTRRAREIQREIRKKLEKRRRIDFDAVDLIAAGDVSYRKEGFSKAAVVVYSRKRKKVVEEVVGKSATEFPYIPTFLSFREIPALIEVLEKLKSEPDIFIFDGQGIAHPIGVGLAAHMGFVLEKPSVGCAKSHLYGIYESPPNIKGAYTWVKEKTGEVLGVCLRTRKNVKPLFVSPGWGVDIPLCMDVVMETVTRYKLPDIMRRADFLTKN
ncbi:MAG: endonuclease V [Elusimicrobia bacterium]|nr:endonuclease V [Elusimicrobiota bacterium]